MKINAQWRRHVKAWHESGLSRADYCRQQDVNSKTFSTWTRHELVMKKDAPLEVIHIQVERSAPVVSAQASIMLRLVQGAQLELSITCRTVPALWAVQSSDSSGLALSACLGVKNIGKPCAGKLHARFDEGGLMRISSPSNETLTC